MCLHWQLLSDIFLFLGPIAIAQLILPSNCMYSGLMSVVWELYEVTTEVQITNRQLIVLLFILSIPSSKHDWRSNLAKPLLSSDSKCFRSVRCFGISFSFLTLLQSWEVSTYLLFLILWHCKSLSLRKFYLHVQVLSFLLMRVDVMKQNSLK